MTASQISFKCPCGEETMDGLSIGLTHDHKLVVVWQCKQCNKLCQFVYSLSELWRDCPKPRKALKAPLKFNDDAFLKRLGISPT